MHFVPCFFLSDLVPKAYRKLTLRHRESVTRMMATARKSVFQERKMRRESRMGTMSNMQPGGTHTETQD